MEKILSYPQVNDALNTLFFDGKFAGQPVYLSLDNDMKDQIANLIGEDSSVVEEEICRCIGRFLDRKGNPYASAIVLLEAWRVRGMTTPPPFTGVLFCLAYAASIMGGDEKVGSNDYYHRLEQVTGVDHQRLTLNGKSTDALWSALNEWLLNNNYELGRPTARALNSWKYVGLAISQAIVRAGDREQFHDLFKRYGFSGNEIMSSKEMALYVSHWMASSRPSQRLRNAWKDKELKERIAEAAIAELAAWSSKARKKDTAGRHIGSCKLTLLANLVIRFPTNKLELHVGKTGDDTQEGPFTVKGHDSEFYLSNDMFGAFATISPSPLGKEGEGLGRDFRIEDADGLSLDWHPRIIIPFAKSQQGYWMEVTRVAFGVPHLVLVRDANSVPKAVESYFSEATNNAYIRSIHGEMPGVPQGWVLYADVQVRHMVTSPRKDLECLVPLAGEGNVTINQGLQLLAGFYHSDVPLQISFIASGGPTHIEVYPIGVDEQAAITEAHSEDGECALDIDGSLDRAASGVRIKAWKDRADPDYMEVHFRNGNRPTPLNLDHRGRLSYQSIMTASPQDKTSETFVEGYVCHGQMPALHGNLSMDVTSIPSGIAEEAQEPPFSVALMEKLSEQTCVERGYHYWKCETLPPGKPCTTPLEQHCTGCGLSLIVIDRGKKQAQTLPKDLVRLPASRSVIPTTRPMDFDLLLDALCFLGSGSWGKFQSIVNSLRDEPTMLRAVAHDLFLLGFLDLELRKGTNSVKSWCVPGPALGFVDASTAVLSGFRSQSLLDAVEEALAPEKAGQLTRETIAGRPTLIRVEGIEPQRLELILQGVRDPLGRNIRIVAEPALGLSRASLSLKALKTFLVPISIGRPRNLQKFDLASARWIDIPMAMAEGAYRWNEGLQFYAFQDKTASAQSGPYQLVKLLAGRDSGVLLHGYDARNATFMSTLGCEPPGLYERVLVACSGRLPRLIHGIVSYLNVPESIASFILDQIYPESSCNNESIKSYKRI